MLRCIVVCEVTPVQRILFLTVSPTQKLSPTLRLLDACLHLEFELVVLVTAIVQEIVQVLPRVLVLALCAPRHPPRASVERVSVDLCRESLAVTLREIVRRDASPYHCVRPAHVVRTACARPA